MTWRLGPGCLQIGKTLSNVPSENGMTYLWLRKLNKIIQDIWMCIYIYIYIHTLMAIQTSETMPASISSQEFLAQIDGPPSFLSPASAFCIGTSSWSFCEPKWCAHRQNRCNRNVRGKMTQPKMYFPRGGSQPKSGPCKAHMKSPIPDYYSSSVAETPP